MPLSLLSELCNLETHDMSFLAFCIVYHDILWILFNGLFSVCFSKVSY